MKVLAKLLGAAILGSVLTVALVAHLGIFEKKIIIRQEGPAAITPAKYQSLSHAELESLDFTEPAELGMPAVVHITSTVAASSRRGRSFEEEELPESFKDFFGPFLFRDPNERDGRPQMGSGSGVIIDPEGYIVTNNHVVEDADELEVSLLDNRSYTATVVGTDPSTDLALLKIEAKGLPFLSVANSDQVKVGQWVLAIGNPFNLNSTVTAGIVSAKARSIDILREKSNSPIESFIQTDAAVNPGNSGGALINMEGELIGINTAIASPTGAYSGYSFAVPSNIVTKVIEDLRSYGIVQRGYIGAIIIGVNGNFAKEKGLYTTEGVYIDSLTGNSSAAEAGLLAGDVITQVDGVETKSSPELLEQIGRHRPGDQIEITVNRFGEEIRFPVTLKNSKGNTEVVKKEAKAQVLASLGATFNTLSEDDAEAYGIEYGVQVDALETGILKDETELQEGFVITHVDGERVADVEELTAILKRKKGGVMLEGKYPRSSRTHYYAFGWNP